MARILPAVLLLGLHSVPARGGAPSPSTHAGDLTIIQTSVRARGARAARIRSRIPRPRPLPAALVGALVSPVLLLEGAPIAPWTPGQILRNALGLAFRACDLPLPALLLPEEVDRLADEITRPAGVTTTTTLPEECDGIAQLEPQTLTDPAYPGCADLEWITPAPDCADDVIFDLIDVATGQPVGPLLFGHTTQATSVFGHPIRLILH